MNLAKSMRAPQPNPYLVLAVAILLPGVGHILAGKTQRGLGFAFFTLVGAWLTTKFAAPDIDIVGRHAAGLFVWALSVPDAYRSARLRELKSSSFATASPVVRSAQ